MSDSLSDYISTKDAADLLGVLPTSINHLIYDGKLQGRQVGRSWLVFRPSLDDYLKTKAPGGRPTSKEPKLTVAH